MNVDTERLHGLVDEPGFAAALDQLVADIHGEHIQPFIVAHADAIGRHVPDGLDGSELLISFLTGWMLGYPAALATDERRVDIAQKHIRVAAFAAGMCSAIVGDAAKKWRS